MSTFCVVGGGLSGLEFALNSARRGNQVVVIDSGPGLRKKHVHCDMRTLEGDEKKVYWTADAHWSSGGINERLGGRSLCYHGVMLPIENSSLESWPSVWQTRLGGPDGLYYSLQKEFAETYPQMTQREPGGLALSHVPQAARVMEDSTFSSYSPLYHLEPFIRDGLIQIERATVARVEKKADGFCLIDQRGQRLHRQSFDKCILAASAIINNKIIASSLERSITAPITDHYCIGIAVRTNFGERLADYRHEMIWHGYAGHHDLNANIFVVERPNLPGGDRLLLMMAVMEQNPHQGDMSRLHCRYGSGKTTLDIESNHSAAVIDNYNRLGRRLVGFGSELLRVDLAPLLDTHSERSGAFFGSNDDPSLQLALQGLMQTGKSNVYTRFAFPYGSYEHESCTHPIGGKGDTALTDAMELTTMPGVFAVGPGAFPRLGIANPALTICSLSRWLASHI